MRINHNIAALNTYRQLTINNTQTGKSIEKLSSGLRINRASDDAAGLAISEKMRAQVRGLEQASRNAQDAISLIQTAEGGLNETHAILQRMRELANQAANDTNVDVDRNEIQKEINQLTSEINRIGNTTEFNTQKLLRGGITGEISRLDHVPGVAGSSGTAGTTTFTITKQLGVGDKFVIGEKEYTAVAAGETAGSGEFNIGATIEDTAENLKKLLSGDSGLDATVTGSGAKITLTQSTAADATEPFSVKLTNDNNYEATMQIGANYGQGFAMNIQDMRSAALKVAGTVAGDTITAGDGAEASYVAVASVTNGTDNNNVEFALDVSSHEKATAAISVINDAIETVSAERSKLGAFQNRLEHTINNLGTSAENLTAAESRIRDVDMAKEMMEFTKQNILSQAAQAMLAQANQQPQGVLQLLR